MLPPIKPKPRDTVTNRVDILLRLLFRIGIVKAQMTDTSIIMRYAEIKTDTLGMANVQIAIRLGRKSRFHTPVPFAGTVILINNIANKIGRY